MTLAFINPARSYDETQGRVQFWGHDRSVEVRFLLEESALFKLYPRTQKAEAGILAAFDTARDRIREVANRAYVSSRRSFYILSASDF